MGELALHSTDLLFVVVALFGAIILFVGCHIGRAATNFGAALAGAILGGIGTMLLLNALAHWVP